MAKKRKSSARRAKNSSKQNSKSSDTGVKDVDLNGTKEHSTSKPELTDTSKNNTTMNGKVLSKEEQKSIVKRLLSQANEQGLQVGAKQYIISTKWWTRWSEYVDFDDQKEKNQQIDAPAPSIINNSPLLQSPADAKSDVALDDLMGGPLRPQLKEGYHYTLLPKEVWDALVCWYGGGPTIARFVIEVGDPSVGHSFLRVQIYPELSEDEDSTDADQTVEEDAEDFSTIAESVKEDLSRFCGACRSSANGKHLKKCSSCGVSYYCNVSCQRAHWKYHKSICRSNMTVEEKVAILSASHAKERRGKTGLRNLGNTCFLNSALQCLSHVEPLTNYFLSNKFTKDLNKDNPLGTGGNLAEEYDNLLKELWFGTNITTAPSALKRAISRFAPQFSGYQQHDAQELLAYLLDGLHEDLNRIIKKPYVEVKDSDGKESDEVVAKQAWDNHRLRNDSMIVDTIQGQFKSTVICPECSKVSITFDPFNCIQLELPSQQTRNMVVFFVPLNNESAESRKTMMRLCVQVPKNGFVRDVKKQVAEMIGGNLDPQHLLAADIFQATVYRIIGNMERLTRLRDDDRILLYETQRQIPLENNVYYGFLYHRLGNAVVGDPIMYQFSEESTCADMLKQWSELLSVHVRFKSASEGEYTISPQILSQCVFLTNRDGEFLRREPLPYAEDAHFIDFIRSAVQHNIVTPSELSFMSITWNSPALASLGPQPSIGKIVDHISIVEHTASSREPSGLTLEDCFQKFTKAETLDEANLWYCSNCEEHRQAQKQMEIWQLPEVLILSLKRFEYRNEIIRDKIDIFVDFPLENLDMTPFCLSAKSGKKQIYDLFAVSNHYGGMGFGHYTAFAKSWKDGDGEKYPGWYSFDDSHVSPVMSTQVKSNAAYILFYHRKND